MEPERKIFKAIIDVNELPEAIKKILKSLGDERQLIVKGGYAKAVFEWCLIRNKEHPKCNNLRALLDKNTDLDIIFVFSTKEEREKLSQRFNLLKDKLSGLGVNLKGNDIEVERNKKFLREERLAEKILKTRDLTINEVLLFPLADENKWAVYCTDLCQRDTLEGVGALTSNTKMTIWYSLGRIVPTNYGLFRLLRFLIDGKVGKIYLPQWWVDINLKEAERLGHPNLGAYGLLLAHKYINNERLQKKMMIYLNALGITDSVRFSEYFKELDSYFQNQNEVGFEIKQNFSFEEIQEIYKERQEKRLKSQQARKQALAECDHYIEPVDCRYCKMNCRINPCIKCKFVEIIPQGFTRPVRNFRYLLCNYNWRYVKIYWNREGFFPRKS